MLKNILSILLILLTTNLCFAEETVTCPATPKTNKGPWSNAFNFGYNKTSGNSDVSLLNLGFVNKYEEDSHLWRLQADYNFGETTEEESGKTETNVDYSFVSGEYKEVLTEKFYVGMGTDYLRNEVAEVKYRVMANPKIGYFVFKEDKVGSFDVYVGPSYLWEEVDGASDSYLAPKIGNRFEYQLTETAKFFETFDIILSADSSDNYIGQGEIGLETKVSESINLVFKVREIYDNQPAEGKDKSDLALLTGLKVDF